MGPENILIMCFRNMEVIMELKVEAPRKIGDVVCENVADTGVAVIVTRGID